MKTTETWAEPKVPFLNTVKMYLILLPLDILYKNGATDAGIKLFLFGIGSLGVGYFLGGL